MKIQEFVESFKKTRDKIKCCNEHIKTTYIPFEKKRALCENIINTSMYKKINGKKMFYVDSVIKFELYNITLVREYTDLELSSDGAEMLAEYNLLEEVNVMPELVKAIGVDAMAFDQVLQMMVEDAFTNNSLEAKLDTKFEALELMFNALSEVSNDGKMVSA